MSDSFHIAVIEKRFMAAAKKIQDLSLSVGMAKTVRAYDSDRRKRILAVEVVKALKDGASSATEAEHQARASEPYQASMKRLYDELEHAEKIIAEYDAAQCAWDTSRSLLSLQRESLRTLEG
jgi:hypothetical protein